MVTSKMDKLRNDICPVVVPLDQSRIGYDSSEEVKWHFGESTAWTSTMLGWVATDWLLSEEALDCDP